MGFYILCPYYMSDKRLTISCEDGMRIFDDKETKFEWIHRVCEKRWQTCEYAQRLQDIYERCEDMDSFEKELLQNQIESLEQNNHALLSERGRLKSENEKLQKEIKSLEKDKDRLMSEIDSMNKVAEHNNKLYENRRKDDGNLITSLKAQVSWMSSVAGAFLVAAHGGEQEFQVDKKELGELMTKYTMKWETNDALDFWTVRVEENAKEE